MSINFSYKFGELRAGFPNLGHATLSLLKIKGPITEYFEGFSPFSCKMPPPPAPASVKGVYTGSWLIDNTPFTGVIFIYRKACPKFGHPALTLEF